MDISEYDIKKNMRKKNLDKRKHIGRKKGAKKNDYGNRSNPSSKPFANIYFDTQQYCNQHFNRRIKEQSICYDIHNIEQHDNVIGVYNDGEPVIEVQNMDTLDAAEKLLNDNNSAKILVLNMASDYKPGGGVASGKTAQEECIFRRTNAFMTHPEEWYPLESSDVILSPSVTIVKDSYHQLLPQMDQKNVGMIAVAALRKPKLNGLAKYYYDEDRLLMSTKIESIFKIAIIQNFDTLVLGALGCGVFNNPPEEVAQIFKSMIITYGKHFKRIVFAVLCVKPKDYDNFRIFENILSS